MQLVLVQLEILKRLLVIGAILLTFGLLKPTYVFQNWQGNLFLVKTGLIFKYYYYGL